MRAKSKDTFPSSFIVSDGIPKAKYWQGEDKYIFHPMQAGRWLYNYPTYENYQSLLKISKKSKNGGLLWYYPNEYKLLRMIGREVTSCISQAEFLTAFNKLYDLRIITKEEMMKVFLSFSSNEINYDDSLLELPLKNNYPEVILNGWQHAVIRIIDFYKNTEIGFQFLQRTLRKMSELLIHFDDEKNKISKYSNLSPYRLKISNYSNPIVKYDTHHTFKLIDYVGSIYECCLKKSEKSGIAYIGNPYNCSPTIIDDSPFSIELYSGKYSPIHTTPTQGGKLIRLQSVKSGEKHIISLKDCELFTGYPTPFTKNKNKNYYHVYHVVALGEIIKSFDSEYNVIFKEYYDKWKSYIDDRNFAEIGIVEHNLNKARYIA